jgi:hypothetical protein
MSQRLVDRASSYLESRSSRRSFLMRTAVVGSALAAAPLQYLLKPGTAYAAVCGDGASCSQRLDGFCCTSTTASTAARPAPSSAAGGRPTRRRSAARAGAAAAALHHRLPRRVHRRLRLEPLLPLRRCADLPLPLRGTSTCDQRKTCCNNFRYGQCHQEMKLQRPGRLPHGDLHAAVPAVRRLRVLQRHRQPHRSATTRRAWRPRALRSVPCVTALVVAADRRRRAARPARRVAAAQPRRDPAAGCTRSTRSAASSTSTARPARRRSTSACVPASPCPARHESRRTTSRGTAARARRSGSASSAPGTSTLLAFLSSGCLTCLDFWHAFEREEHLAARGHARWSSHQGPGAGERLAASPSSRRPASRSSCRRRRGSTTRCRWRRTSSSSTGRPGVVRGEGAASSWRQLVDLHGPGARRQRLSRKRKGRRTPAVEPASATRLGDRDRADLIDRELTSAGIRPGDSSLYPSAPVDEQDHAGHDHHHDHR